jgi:hypothetical protein
MKNPVRFVTVIYECFFNTITFILPAGDPSAQSGYNYVCEIVAG